MWQEMLNKIISDSGNPIWWVSQVFALMTLISFIWCFQIKNKVKMMLITGIGCLTFSISAFLLPTINVSVGILFGLAAIRNFVFSFIDWRVSKGKPTARWISYVFCGFFIAANTLATILLVSLWPQLTLLKDEVVTRGLPWGLGLAIELIMSVTLTGLVLGNIMKGTDLMRVSFVVNRSFTIINHLFVNNLIGMVIAASAIISNIVYYIRFFINWIKKRNIVCIGDEDKCECWKCHKLKTITKAKSIHSTVCSKHLSEKYGIKNWIKKDGMFELDGSECKCSKCNKVIKT